MIVMLGAAVLYSLAFLGTISLVGTLFILLLVWRRLAVPDPFPRVTKEPLVFRETRAILEQLHV